MIDEDGISEMDWKNFAVLEEFLRPFLEATRAISCDKYATLSLVVPWYNAILDHLETVKVLKINEQSTYYVLLE